MSTNPSSQVEESGIELRKRFYQETECDTVKHESKRTLFGTLKEFMMNPIGFFTPKEKKVGEVTVTVSEDTDGGVSVQLKNEKNEVIHKIYLTENSDFQKDIEEVNNSMKLLLQNIIKNTSVGAIVIDKEEAVSKNNTILKVDERKESILVSDPVEILSGALNEDGHKN